jgi:plasmid stability protein
MVLGAPSRWSLPWNGGGMPRPGEDDPVRIAAGLRQAFADAGEKRSAVVGVDRRYSVERWQSAPAIGQDALLILPTDGFPAGSLLARDELSRAWGTLRQASAAGESLPALVIVVSAESPARFAARLRDLARDPALAGKLLGAWSLASGVREDLPAALLAEGKLAAVGLASSSVVELRRAPEQLAALARVIREASQATRVEALPGPFVWHF